MHSSLALRGAHLTHSLANLMAQKTLFSFGFANGSRTGSEAGNADSDPATPKKRNDNESENPQDFKKRKYVGPF